jgi:hypothetical protein
LHESFCKLLHWSSILKPLLVCQVLQVQLSWRASLSLGGTTRNVTPWFSWTHQTLKNHRKHLNECFHGYFLTNTFIRFHKFFKPNNIKNITYFDVPNQCI